jgi:SRSO17 transposase
VSRLDTNRKELNLVPAQLLQVESLLADIKDLVPVKLCLVNKTVQEETWDRLVRSYHYLGYKKMYGPRIKYLAMHCNQPLAALSFNRATLRVGVRDRYIGWDDGLKNEHLDRVVCNNRFLILPWVKIPNLASHILAQAIRRLPEDWFKLYGHRIFMVETFVDTAKFNGTCYKAAGFILLGQTQGFAKAGPNYTYHGKQKAVFIKVLDQEFHLELGTRPDPRPLRIRYAKGRGEKMILARPCYDPNILKACGLAQEDLNTVTEMLEDYLNLFKPCYRRSEQKNQVDTFITGLLSDLERKSIEPVALKYSGPDGVRTMQMFFKNSPFDDEMMLNLYQNQLSKLIGDEEGMLNVDGSDFPKKGPNSVGVMRQRCGIMGKTDNCQAGVFLGYSSVKGYGLLDRRLYIPQKWFGTDYEALRKQTAVPEDLTFQTKNELALSMINEAMAKLKLPYKWIGCDSAFGVDRTFLETLPQGCYYFADTRSNQLVFKAMPEMEVPPPSGKSGRPFKHLRPSFLPVKVSSYAEDENLPWQRISLAEGAKGPIVADVKLIRCVSCHSSTPFGNYLLPHEEVWLYIRRYNDGRIKYSLCNAPADTPLETLHRVATMRWPIEQCFQECKSHLGMGHYETRSYRAWYRHMLFVMIAHLFTIMLRLRFKKNSCINNADG